MHLLCAGISHQRGALFFCAHTPLNLTHPKHKLHLYCIFIPFYIQKYAF